MYYYKHIFVKYFILSLYDCTVLLVINYKKYKLVLNTFNWLFIHIYIVKLFSIIYFLIISNR